MIKEEKYVKIISSPSEKVKSSGVIRNQDITITSNGVYTPDEGYSGIGKATVNVPQNAVLVTKTITENGIYNASSDSADGFSSVEVDVSGGSSAVIESKNITPTTSQQIITASGSVDGYSPITVEAVTSSIDANIVSSNIKQGVTILGVTGSYEGSAVSTLFGVDAEMWSPVYSDNGVLTSDEDTFLELPRMAGSLVFNGITDIADNALYADEMSPRFSNVTTITGVSFPDLTSITGDNAMWGAFKGCTGITSVSMPNLTTINADHACYQAFSGCTGITSINLSSLQIISGSSASCYNMFSGCTGITSADLGSLERIQSLCSGMFYGCTNLSSVILTSLKRIEARIAHAFENTALTRVDFTSLNYISASAASTDYTFTSTFGRLTNFVVYFYALKSNSFGSNAQLRNMFANSTNCTVHFPISTQSTISAWQDYTDGFGGTNTTVLFDIVQTLTGADGNTYTRNQVESTNSYICWTYNNTKYYTSGITEPAVSDSIYSDSDCTTEETTVSAIA